MPIGPIDPAYPDGRTQVDPEHNPDYWMRVQDEAPIYFPGRRPPVKTMISEGKEKFQGESPILSVRFHEILDEIGDLHDVKQIDYGTDQDPFHNIRASAGWGVPAWVGAMVRLSDKVNRLQAFVRNGSLKNEGVEDSLKDIAVYAIIALVLFEEGQSEQ